MISIELYVTVAIVAGILALYGLMDMRNKFYANIVSLFISSLLVWYLSITIGNGTLQTGVIINQTTGLTTPLILQDSGLGWLLIIPAVAAMIATSYLTYEAYDEVRNYRKEQEDRS
jgi:hypothetical protein